MDLLTTPETMTAWSDARRFAGQRIGLVPTMGFLHDGHASLMDLLRPRCDALVVSIFVNPLQFGANEDLDRYPRDLPGDLARCEAHGVDAVFAPDAMYPPGFATKVRVERLTAGLCGAFRPVHFEGVTTVVARLLGLARADVAVFGEKDWQQLVVIRRMVEDLAIPCAIVPGPVVRDDDGLALSSRNKYLSADERRRALSLSRALRRIRDAVAGGTTDVATLVGEGRALLDVDALDYLEVVDALSLEPLLTVDRPARALVAAHVGRTRLIDNVGVGGEVSW
jgi:pantoate--beta-alanine ligase